MSISRIRQSFRLWNRRRLADRDTGRFSAKQAKIDLALRRHQLGQMMPVMFPEIIIGVASNGMPLNKEAIQRIKICTDIAASVGLLKDQITIIYPESGDAGESQERWHAATMIKEFGKRKCSVYIAISSDYLLHPSFLKALLWMNQAQKYQALIDAADISLGESRVFDANLYDLDVLCGYATLVPYTVLPLLKSVGVDSFSWQLLSRLASRKGFSLKYCPSALIGKCVDDVTSCTAVDNELLSVVCRFHDISRLFELERAVFSLACSTYAPIELIIVTQSFSIDEIDQARQIIELSAASARLMSIEWVEHGAPKGVDVRSDLLNFGIKACHGRYLSFLDHDDTVRPGGYSQLIRHLEAERVVIAFGGVALKFFDCFDDVAQLEEVDNNKYTDGNLINMFEINNCPIHSYVIDLHGVAQSDLEFDTRLSRFEDYMFLLRLCSKYRSSFKLRKTIVADYFFKSDGSNSTPHVADNQSVEKHRLWLEAKDRIKELKAKLKCSPEVIASLGLSSRSQEWTIAEVVKAKVHK